MRATRENRLASALTLKLRPTGRAGAARRPAPGLARERQGMRVNCFLTPWVARQGPLVGGRGRVEGCVWNLLPVQSGLTHLRGASGWQGPWRISEFPEIRSAAPQGEAVSRRRTTLEPSGGGSDRHDGSIIYNVPGCAGRRVMGVDRFKHGNVPQPHAAGL